jgi:hypothetical protein
MNISNFSSARPLRSALLPLLIYAALGAAPALAAQGEDSLVCARVRDPYAAQRFQAAMWPRSARYGSMTWCDLQVKAVEHCVPAQATVEDTDAPYEGFYGPDLTTEYTCYKVRCANGEGARFLGESVTIDDTYGERSAAGPKVARICVPNR